jgi:hypothetical protein
MLLAGQGVEETENNKNIINEGRRGSVIDWLGRFGKTGIVAERWLWTGDEIQATEVTLARYSPVPCPRLLSFPLLPIPPLHTVLSLVTHAH